MNRLYLQRVRRFSTKSSQKTTSSVVTTVKKDGPNVSSQRCQALADVVELLNLTDSYKFIYLTLNKHFLPETTLKIGRSVYNKNISVSNKEVSINKLEFSDHSTVTVSFKGTFLHTHVDRYNGS